MRQAVAVDLVDDDITMFARQDNGRYELMIEGEGCAVVLSGSLKQFASILAAMRFDPTEPQRPHLRPVATP